MLSGCHTGFLHRTTPSGGQQQTAPEFDFTPIFPARTGRNARAELPGLIASNFKLDPAPFDFAQGKLAGTPRAYIDDMIRGSPGEIFATTGGISKDFGKPCEGGK